MSTPIKEYDLYKKLNFDEDKVEKVRGYPIKGAFQFEIKLQSSDDFQVIQNNQSESFEYEKPHALILMKTLGVGYDNIERLFFNQNIDVAFNASPAFDEVNVDIDSYPELRQHESVRPESQQMKEEVHNYLLNSYADYLDKDKSEKFLKKAILKAQNNNGAFTVGDVCVRADEGTLSIESPSFKGNTVQLNYEGKTPFESHLKRVSVLNNKGETIYDKSNEEPIILEKRMVKACHELFDQQLTPNQKSKNSYK